MPALHRNDVPGPGQQWQPFKSGNSIVLTSADGESAVYLLQSVTSTEPYFKTVDITTEASTCKSVSTHVFSAADGSHEITLNFEHLDIIGTEPANQLAGLSIEATLSEPVPGEPENKSAEHCAAMNRHQQQRLLFWHQQSSRT